MSGYKVEQNTNAIYQVKRECYEIEYVEYNNTYSKLQRKRFNKVLNQLTNSWLDVYKQLKILLDHSALNKEDIEEINNRLCKLFIVVYKSNSDYYKDETIRRRKQKGYMSKKLNKLRTSKQKL